MKIEDTKRIIIKIGSSLLFNSETKKHNKEWLISLAEDVNFLKNQNKDVIIVSSGAIAFGAKDLNLEMSELRLDIHQALAAIGQINLMSAFKNAFEKYESKISQVLLTLDDTEKRRRSINARRTIDNLLKLGIVPVVNENDTIATSEIKYGDNDRLAARVAQIIGADILIIFSDVDGLYDKSKSKKIVKNIDLIDNKITSLIEKTKNIYGSGNSINADFIVNSEDLKFSLNFKQYPVLNPDLHYITNKEILLVLICFKNFAFSEIKISFLNKQITRNLYLINNFNVSKPITGKSISSI